MTLHAPSPGCFGVARHSLIVVVVVSIFYGTGPTPSLTKSPHENVVGAVAIDDRIERMSILFPKANFDLLTMLQHDCLSMLDRIRYRQSCSSVERGIVHLWHVNADAAMLSYTTSLLG